MVTREIHLLAEEYARQFRSLLIVGPRQSGKSTLAKQVFGDKPYLSLENPDTRAIAASDPRGFLGQFPDGAILDEIQRLPELLNYLQEILDNTDRDALFVLTGSNNLLLQDTVSQSLAGRVGVLDLLPLTIAEISQFDGPPSDLDEAIFKGCYPEVYHRKRNPSMWYNAYLRTYVERDVRLIRSIENLMLFEKFLRICAGRTGQQVNVSAIGNECGIDMKTVNAWLSVLEATFVIKLLPPFYQSFNKRVVKAPKLYFIDTGLACTLLGISKPEELALSHFRGALVENYVVSEIDKKLKNKGSGHRLYYWRDHKGVEIDLLIDRGIDFIPVEIKSSETFHPDFLRNLKKFNDYSDNNGGWLVYGGQQESVLKDDIRLMNWSRLPL
jgi:uncharacterized protein